MVHPTSAASSGSGYLWFIVVIAGIILAFYLFIVVTQWFHNLSDHPRLIRVPHKSGRVIAFPAWRVRAWCHIQKHHHGILRRYHSRTVFALPQNQTKTAHHRRPRSPYRRNG